MNNRLSLSVSNLSGSPAAESTHLLQSNICFPWGEESLTTSPKKLVKKDLSSSNRNISKSNFNLHNIDVRTYTDVLSKGLTSRIAKYHNINNSNLNRSLSVNSLYSKPGQFPVVHLKKNQIPCKTIRNKNVSIIRIAPPDKGVFEANTRASILRTGSVVPTIGLQKFVEASRENRPILHPSVENEVAPTRSVLDDLKEISRKRINSDELDSNDSMKKYCKETENITATAAASGTIQQQLLISSLYAPNKGPSKRQREPQFSSNLSIPHESPEQLGIKRRLYSNTNNDITSSLSSSLRFVSPSKKNVETTPERQDQQKTKQKININNNESNINANNVKLSGSSPLTTATPFIEQSSLFKGQPMKASSAEQIYVANTSTTASITNKPKLTLFNKIYTEEKSIEENQHNKNNLKESTGLRFVKPKPNNSNYSAGLIKNSLNARTQKTKLALMLSGLRGDINNIDNEISSDEIDSSSSKMSDDNGNSKQLETNNYENLNATPTTLSSETTTTISTKTITSPTTNNLLNSLAQQQVSNSAVESEPLKNKSVNQVSNEIISEQSTVAAPSNEISKVIIDNNNTIKTALTTNFVNTELGKEKDMLFENKNNKVNNEINSNSLIIQSTSSENVTKNINFFTPPNTQSASNDTIKLVNFPIKESTSSNVSAPINSLPIVERPNFNFLLTNNFSQQQQQTPTKAPPSTSTSVQSDSSTFSSNLNTTINLHESSKKPDNVLRPGGFSFSNSSDTSTFSPNLNTTINLHESSKKSDNALRPGGFTFSNSQQASSNQRFEIVPQQNVVKETFSFIPKNNLQSKISTDSTNSAFSSFGKQFSFSPNKSTFETQMISSTMNSPNPAEGGFNFKPIDKSNNNEQSNLNETFTSHSVNNNLKSSNQELPSGTFIFNDKSKEVTIPKFNDGFGVSTTNLFGNSTKGFNFGKEPVQNIDVKKQPTNLFLFGKEASSTFPSDQNSSSNKTFSFMENSSTNTSNNAFSNAAPAVNQKPEFKFSGTNQTISQHGFTNSIPTANNVLQSNTSGDRLIRKATRRLQQK